jgi:hypothetical protein
MYTNRNFKTKKELKAAIESGTKIGFFQPGPFGGNEPRNGTIYLEGPHYPAPHKWYAQAEVRDGFVVKVK